MIRQVKEVRILHPRMGSRPLYYKLDNPGMGINKMEQLMSEHYLTIPVKRTRILTTQADRNYSFPNLINGLEINDINQLAVGDITYYRRGNDLYYIFSLKDVYSGRIVGLTGGDNMEGDKAMVCLNQLENLRGAYALKGLIHHSDGGGQYRSKIYLERLMYLEIEISQAENCLQNGCAEQFHGTLKNEYLFGYNIKNVADLLRALNHIQYLINYDRPVKNLGYMTPVEYEKYIENIPKGERRIVKCYDFNEWK